MAVAIIDKFLLIFIRIDHYFTHQYRFAKSIHTTILYIQILNHFSSLLQNGVLLIMLANQTDRDPILTRKRQRSLTPAVNDLHLGRMEEVKRDKRKEKKGRQGCGDANKKPGNRTELTAQNSNQSDLESERNGSVQTRIDLSELDDELSPNKDVDNRPVTKKSIDHDDLVSNYESDKENEDNHEFETMKDVVNKTMSTIDEGIAANMQICDNLSDQAVAFGGGSAIEMLHSVCMMQQQQTAWMRNSTVILGLMRDEILQPCAAFIAENTNRKRRRRVIKPANTNWKKEDIIIELKDKSQHQLGSYEREQITKLVILYQNTWWPEPEIGGIGLKDEIQIVLGRYFSLIDEPRKVGYIVSQFLRKQEFYQRFFIPKYYVTGARRMEMERRTVVSRKEKELFKDIVLYIGGKLVAQFPAGRKSSACDKTEAENKQMDFLNSARDAVNQRGLNQRDGQKTANSFMDHIEDFMPLLERKEHKAFLKAVADEDETSVREEQKKGGERPLLLSPTTSRPTKTEFAQRSTPSSSTKFASTMSSPSPAQKTPKIVRLSDINAPPLVINFASPRRNEASAKDHSAAQDAFLKAMKEMGTKN